MYGTKNKSGGGLVHVRRGMSGNLAWMVVVAPATLAYAQEPTPIVRVEEDWKLVLNEPNDDADCPQFHTVMSPTCDVNSSFAEVLWNYREVPEYASGGIQLRSWADDALLRRRTVEMRTLSDTAESITWTQALEVSDVGLTFLLKDGNSTTWGSFGRDMVIDIPAGTVDLSAYRTAVSAENSCITYGSNRVESLQIVAVRHYGPDDELLAEETTPQMVYELGDDESEEELGDGGEVAGE